MLCGMDVDWHLVCGMHDYAEVFLASQGECIAAAPGYRPHRTLMQGIPQRILLNIKKVRI